MTTDDRAHLGATLASWLDGLDLSDHLAAAGLPTFERDPEGRVAWTDPVTGEALDVDQLEQLDRMLHHDGSEPEHAVPVALLQVAREARLRKQLLAGAWFTYDTLAELRGTSVNATRFAVHKAASGHRLLVVPVDERTIVPAFQLTADGEVRPELEPVIAPILAAGMAPWRAWAWLTRPAALLGGLVPEQAAADPTESATVVTAAVHLAERVASPTR